MKSIITILLFITLLINATLSQQICLQSECALQLKACDQSCQNKL